MKSDPSSEASTGAKKPELSFRKTRLFILFRLVGVCIYASVYDRTVDANRKSPLAEGVDDDNGTDVVVDALVDVIHFFLQSVSKRQFEG